MTTSRPIIGIMLLVLSLWALSCLDASGKWVMAAGVPLMIVGWMRYTIHLILVLSITVPFQGWKIVWSQQPKMQIMRGISMLGGTLLFFTTLSYMPQAEASAIVFLAPLIVLLLAPWLLNEATQLSRWIAAGSAFIGILIIIRPTGGLPPLGITFGLLTACCFAIQFIATRLVAKDNPFTSLIWGGAIGMACLTVVLLLNLVYTWSILSALSLSHWLLMILMGVLGALGHFLQIGAYRYATASVLAPFIYLQIISATILGWLIWGHFPDPLTWLGIAIVCLSGSLIGIWEWYSNRQLPLESANSIPKTESVI